MARGGRRPGAGRKKGQSNQKTRAIAEGALASGITPLEYMLEQMRKPYPDDADAVTKARLDAMRFEAAKAAAPYMHPRLTSVELGGKADGNPIRLTVEDVSVL